MSKPAPLLVAMLVVALAVLMPLSTSPATAIDDGGLRSTIPLRLVGSHALVPVAVNGRGPVSFLLDTGASSSVVGLELARRVGLMPREQRLVGAVGGSALLPRARASSVSLDGNEVQGLPVLISDLSRVRAVDGDIQGILGNDFLSRFNYSLDFAVGRLGLDRYGMPPRGVRVPLQLESGRALLMASGARLVLDTGAGGLVLFGRPRDLGFRIERSEALTRIASIAGSRYARTGSIGELRLAPEIVLREVPVTMMDLPPGTGRPPEDGLLPARLLGSVYVNQAEGYLVWKPRWPP